MHTIRKTQKYVSSQLKPTKAEEGDWIRTFN